MNRLEREAMVERYLACEMRADEERTFMMQVATDPELFETLRAYRYMEHSLRGDSNRLLSTDRFDEHTISAFTSLPIPAATPGRAKSVGTPRAMFTRGSAATLGVTAIVAGTLGYVGHMALSEPDRMPTEPVAAVHYRSTPSVAPPTTSAPLALETPASDTVLALRTEPERRMPSEEIEAGEATISTGAAPSPQRVEQRKQTSLRTEMPHARAQRKATEETKPATDSAVGTVRTVLPDRIRRTSDSLSIPIRSRVAKPNN